MILAQDLSKSFKSSFFSSNKQVLKSINFSVRENSLTGFLGENGAGKTTCLKLLFQFLKPDKGEIKFDSSLGKTTKEILSKVGYLPERPYFYRDLSAQDFITYLALLSGLKKNEIKEKMHFLAVKLKIEHNLNQKVHTFSKGMLQRLGFLCATIHDPSFLVLDEPLSGLDPVGRRDMKNLIRELYQSGVSIFFSSHIVSDIEEICTDIVVLKAGTVVFEGSPNDLIKGNMSLEETVYDL